MHQKAGEGCGQRQTFGAESEGGLQEETQPHEVQEVRTVRGLHGETRVTVQPTRSFLRTLVPNKDLIMS